MIEWVILKESFYNYYHDIYRLQNSPYFCVFKYARAVKQKVWNEAENRERDWRETLFSLRVRLARVARVRLFRYALTISLLILRKKPTVLQSNTATIRRRCMRIILLRHNWAKDVLNFPFKLDLVVSYVYVLTAFHAC